MLTAGDALAKTLAKSQKVIPTVIPRTGSVFLTEEEARLLYGRKMGVGCEKRRG